MISSLFTSIALSFLVSAGSDDLERDESSPNFQFYLSEMVTHSMPPESPMAKLIHKRLVEATFDTNDENIFRERLEAIEKAAEEHPTLLDRFVYLDRAFQRTFDEKIKSAKRKRMIYAASGAVIGAVVAVPITRLITKQTSYLFLSIPIGALAGGGAGFLLGNLIAMPRYTYEKGMLNWDINVKEQLNREEDDELM